jgi:integrase
MSVFGSKTDPASTGQAAFIPVDPAPASGSSALVRRTTVGLRRLLELDEPTLRALGARFTGALCPTELAGPEALATWPPPIPALASRLYAVGLQAHALPLFGRWLFEELSADSDLLAVPSTGEFQRLAKATLQAAGVPVTRVGAHSFRRGRAAELLHEGTSETIVSQMLRHSNPSSTSP